VHLVIERGADVPTAIADADDRLAA
jgi:hypothetical protein